jgi:hypothetical protein
MLEQAVKKIMGKSSRRTVQSATQRYKSKTTYVHIFALKLYIVSRSLCPVGKFPYLIFSQGFERTYFIVWNSSSNICMCVYPQILLRQTPRRTAEIGITLPLLTFRRNVMPLKTASPSFLIAPYDQ